MDQVLLAQENQSGTRLIADIRRARQGRQPEPVFTDHFAAYKEALAKVLPHVVFAGVNSKARYASSLTRQVWNLASIS